jgi:hypothetical protein
MLPKFLACGLAALALVRATPFQVNLAGGKSPPYTLFSPIHRVNLQPLETAVTAGVEAGNYSLVNVGKNETLFGAGKGQPVYMKSALSTPEPLSQVSCSWFPALGSR